MMSTTYCWRVECRDEKGDGRHGLEARRETARDSCDRRRRTARKSRHTRRTRWRMNREGIGTPVICAVPGDGIGREVVPAALRVLAAVLPNARIVEALAGFEHFEATGTALPEETI